MTNIDTDTPAEPTSYPLIAYVHVPKTAGSTIKKILHLCTPRGHAEAHFLIEKRSSFLEFVSKADWIAGHVSRDKLANNLIWLNRSVEYFASVRDPVAQLVSHLNYSFEIVSRGGYFSQYDRNGQMLDADVRSTDFSNPAAVVALLLRYADHFLNSQSQYLFGDDFREVSGQKLVSRLAIYKYVASEAHLPELCQSFGFMRLPEGISEIRENVSERRFNAKIFDSPPLREFLAHHHSHDIDLYAAVQRASWPAKGRHPFRPVFLSMAPFTSENFDEQTYLDSNPDVASAVNEGYFKSGLEHFSACGLMENRTIRRWVLPPTRCPETNLVQETFTTATALNRLRLLREEHARAIEKGAFPKSATTSGGDGHHS